MAFVKTLKDPSPSVVQAHLDIRRTVQTELTKMQDKCWTNKADELQDADDRHDSRSYKKLKTVFGPCTSVAAPHGSEDYSTLRTD